MYDNKPVEREEYNDHLFEARRLGDYFVTPRSYSRAFGHPLCTFLADLINYGSMRAGKNGWFLCSVKELAEASNWKKNVQTRLLGILRGKGLIEVRNVSTTPPRRAIRIDLLKISREAIKFSGQVKGHEFVSFKEHGIVSYTVKSLFQDSKEEIIPPRKPGGDTKETEMPFFEKKELRIPEKTEEALPVQWSKELRVALAKTRPVFSWSPKKWSESFRSLKKKVGDVPLIQTVLDWYCETVTSPNPPPKFPEFPNAKVFCAQWDWIKSKYDKATKIEAEQKTEITDKAYVIITILKMQIWPKGSASQLPIAVQTTMNNFAAFRQKLAAFCSNNPSEIRTEYVRKGKVRTNMTPAPGHVRFAHRLLAEYCPPDYFAQIWFTQVYNQIVHWEGWSGNLMAMAFDGDVTNKQFDLFCSGICSSWSGSDKEWKVLSKEFR